MINLHDVKLRQLEPNIELNATQFNVLLIKKYIGFPKGHALYEKLRKDMVRELMSKLGEVATLDERAYSYQFLWEEVANHETQYDSAMDVELRLIRVLVEWREARVGELVHGASFNECCTRIVFRHSHPTCKTLFTFESISTENGSYWKRTA